MWPKAAKVFALTIIQVARQLVQTRRHKATDEPELDLLDNFFSIFVSHACKFNWNRHVKTDIFLRVLRDDSDVVFVKFFP